MASKLAESVGDVRDTIEVEWPETGKMVSLLILRCDEIQAAYFAARERFERRSQSVDLFSNEELERERNLQEVFRMVLKEGSNSPKARVFASADEARRRLSLDEVGYFQKIHEHEALKLARPFLDALGALGIDVNKGDKGQ